VGITLAEDTTIFGFVIDQLGAHLGRTIMIEEMNLLLSACPIQSTKMDYRNAIVDDNVLLKRSTGARIETYKRLGQLYALDPQVHVFKILRELWKPNGPTHNLLLLLCALARDPILRSTIDLMLHTAQGSFLMAKDFEKIVAETFPGRMQAKTLASVGRNLASSWTQSGHLVGEKGKVRQFVIPDSIVVAYALFLAYLSGQRGDGFFESAWLRILDTPTHQLHNLAQEASRHGWLEYRHSGQITEITFRHFMEQVDTTDLEKRYFRG
jgi:hypothetical protein